MEEIERKYLLKDQSWKTGLSEVDSSLIQQGYLNSDPDRVVRIRIRDNRAWITIKSRPKGIVRLEYEYQIPVKDARELLDICLGQIIIKRRYVVKYRGNNWEVDEFFGHHEGLVLAEIELESVDQEFDVPEWIAEEVSNEKQYSNMVLALGEEPAQ